MKEKGEDGCIYRVFGEEESVGVRFVLEERRDFFRRKDGCEEGEGDAVMGSIGKAGRVKKRRDEPARRGRNSASDYALRLVAATFFDTVAKGVILWVHWQETISNSNNSKDIP